MEPIEVVVVEDEHFTREGICSLLEKEPDICVTGRAANGEDALRLVRQKSPDVLLLDISMPPGIDGLEVIRRLRLEGSEVLVIALTENERVIAAVREEGGNGFLPKDKYQMLIPTVQCVVRTRSNVFINPEVSKAYLEVARCVEEAELTDLELAAWKLLAYKNEEIARRLYKAPGRIRNVVTSLYFKLDIHDNGKVSQRIQAIRMATLYGILEEPEGLGG